MMVLLIILIKYLNLIKNIIRTVIILIVSHISFIKKYNL